VLVLVLAAGAIGGAYWWTHRPVGMPPGFAWSNGRLEADEIDISTQFAGRIASLRADEGDIVTAGEVVAYMDTRDLEASLRQAIDQAAQAQHAVDAARADLEQQRSVVVLANQELQRAQALVPKGFETREVLDQRQSQMNSALAAANSLQQKLDAASSAQQAATEAVALIRVNIAENILVAPKDGRIEYRLANIGEVLPSGGKVFTMLDTGYVYMDIFLPTAQAGRVVLGSDARIVLDALPNLPIDAKVTYLASQNQFTPKTVETKSERDKLMFRVRVRIDPAVLKAHAQEVRSGLPGVTIIRLDPHAEWPTDLAAKTAQ